MPKIKLPEKCGWFYVLRLRHNGTLGFGRTAIKNIKNYLQKRYIYPCANKDQVFDYLYYGKYSQICALENHIKNELSDKLLILCKDKVEWFDPKENITDKQLLDFIEKRCKLHYPEIFKVKKEFLPFSPSNVFKNLHEDLDKFLVTIH